MLISSPKIFIKLFGLALGWNGDGSVRMAMTQIGDWPNPLPLPAPLPTPALLCAFVGIFCHELTLSNSWTELYTFSLSMNACIQRRSVYTQTLETTEWKTNQTLKVLKYILNSF